MIIHPPKGGDLLLEKDSTKYAVQIKHYNPLSNTERIKPSDIQKFYATKKARHNRPALVSYFVLAFLLSILLLMNEKIIGKMETKMIPSTTSEKFSLTIGIFPKK